jgi:cytochrome c-type biogenesis protein CcsB
MDLLFFKAALAAYFLSTVGYGISLLIKRVVVAKVSMWIFFAAFLLQSLAFGARCIAMQGSPIHGIYDALALLAWIMTGVYLAFQFKTKTRILGAFVSPAAFLLMIVASVGWLDRVPLPAMLQGSLVPLHVMLAVTGEALFALASCAGAMYLVQDTLIKNKKGHSFSRLLPSLIDLDRINHICLLGGFPLLTLGVVVGSVWARTAWGSQWQWDPKQVLTLATWFLYALLLHQRLIIGWRGHKAAWFSILAFLFLLFCVVLSRFAPTLHSFV